MMYNLRVMAEIRKNDIHDIILLTHKSVKVHLVCSSVSTKTD